MLKGVLSKGQKKFQDPFEPLTILELQATENPENRLGFIKEAKVGYPFKSIPYDLNKKSLVFFYLKLFIKLLVKSRVQIYCCIITFMKK